ncbi:Flavohemoprotein [Ephemeroptericola cinctiostellae]|uniref:Flavohemoprotein n=1 Tax=Ephemeroptericola cinctiostellae TaxID=2268024 RepID=A0A345DAF6_9BURK|nr:NO-inducible flavohemoprotein [Ephemeroptericola cinctiostellae]AXF85344.1 Flavohemoprotein [Ephemeroptericola cinctiostellae]
MISNQARPYIEASVPVLQAHGLAITQVFYNNMLSAHPNLRHLFNEGNQASGIQQQALAAAVFAYAANIDNPDALAPVVSRIVHKHASLGITKAHYPIVGEHLIGAIAEVLGEAATPELLAAWVEAYGALADVLIQEEDRLYGEKQILAGDMMRVVVAKRVQDSDEVVSFYLEKEGGGSPGEFLPGQYISVKVFLMALGLSQMRQYSLSDSPEKDYWRISVKSERGDSVSPDGMVSNWLHSHLEPGDILDISPAYGDFTPDCASNDAIVLLSAGVGITPMLSALHSIAHIQPQRQVVFAHAALHADRHVHENEVSELVKGMPNALVHYFYDEFDAEGDSSYAVQGPMTVASFWDLSLAEAQVYMCGPKGFMLMVRNQLMDMDVPLTSIHREIFGPDLLEGLM